jgi:hypothetical protein
MLDAAAGMFQRQWPWVAVALYITHNQAPWQTQITLGDVVCSLNEFKHYSSPTCSKQKAPSGSQQPPQVLTAQMMLSELWGWVSEGSVQQRGL